MGSWTPPPVAVVDVERGSGTTFVTVRLDRDVHPPLAPSSLHPEDGTTVALDVLVESDGQLATFRTSATVPDAIVGNTAGLQQWWTHEAYDAVVDVGRSWVRETPLSDHERCLLDWAKIGKGDEFGWRSDCVWVCDDCYDEYLVRDRLGLRR